MSKKPFEDDGRTVADMSGIDRPNLFGIRRRIKEEKKEPVKEPEPPEPQDETEEQTPPVPEIKYDMSPKDRRAYILGAMGAGLLIGAVFIVAAALFILLLLLLWNK